MAEKIVPISTFNSSGKSTLTWITIQEAIDHCNRSIDIMGHHWPYMKADYVGDIIKYMVMKILHEHCK